MSKNIHSCYISLAKEISLLSYAEKRKVGALITIDGRIVSTGYNGKIKGLDNQCEDEDGNTYEEVVHAEANAILFAAKLGISLNKSSIYITLSPCVNCAKMIIQSGIIEVYYLHDYRNNDGLILLEKCGIKINKIS